MLINLNNRDGLRIWAYFLDASFNCGSLKGNKLASYALFPHMSVAQNIGFGLEMLGKPQAEIDKTVDEMLDLVKMSELKNRQRSTHDFGSGCCYERRKNTANRITARYL